MPDALGYVYSILVLPFLAGAVACLLLRSRESLLGMLGVGHLGNQVAFGARRLSRIDPVQWLGPVDPFIWIVGGSCLVLAVVACLRLLWKRMCRARVSPEQPPS